MCAAVHDVLTCRAPAQELRRRSVSLVPGGALASSVTSLVRHMSRGVQAQLPGLDSLQGSLSGQARQAPLLGKAQGKPAQAQPRPGPAPAVVASEGCDPSQPG